MDKQDFVSLIKVTFKDWQKHDASLTAGALTFFTIMPLPSLALIGVAILAQLYGEHQALPQLVNQVSAFAGPSIGVLVSQLLSNAANPLSSFFGSLISVGFAVSGAIGAFSILQKTMDVIWEVKPVRRRPLAIVKEKAFPFGLIVGLSLLVVAWTTFSTVLFGAMVYLLHPVLGGFTSPVLRSFQVVLSLGLGTVLFAIIFKTLPETRVRWGDVWLAAGITALVFTILNYLFGIYLSVFQITTLAGTAGALMVLFLWIYVMNLFILFGAQLSKNYAQMLGSHAVEIPKMKQESEKKLEISSRLEIKVRDAN